VPAETLTTAALPASEPPDPAAPAQPEPAAQRLPPRITVHFPPSSREAADAAAAALRSQGAVVEVVPVALAIGRTNVRFYHAGDRTGADGVAALLAESLPGEPPLTRDFTGYATPTAPGRVEVWLAGTAPGPRTAAPQPAVPPPPAAAPVVAAPLPGADRLPSNPAVYDPAGPAPTVIPQSQAEEVARIVVERAVERLLQQRTPAE
jgi:hypothetical protein